MYAGFVNGWRREDKEPKRAALIQTQPNYAIDLKPRISSYLPSGVSHVASDLRSFSPPTRHNQLTSQSCVANSITRALENKRIQKTYGELIASGIAPDDSMTQAQNQHVPLSRLALYFLSRESMDPPETDKDDGSIISIAADLLQTFGIAREEPNSPQDRAFWPFDLSKLFVAPSWSAMQESSLHKISSWARITSTGSERVDDVIANLFVGNTVVFGTTVDDQWMNYNNSVIGPINGVVRGRHATMLCGWDPSGFFLDENSWGNHWGWDGFCKVSPDVISSPESSDFVVITGGWEVFHKNA